MQITFVSKNILLTEGLKQFIQTHVEKLQRYSSKQLSNVQILLDVDRQRKAVSEDAVIEIISNVHGKKITVRESGENFYKAFFGAFSKMKTRMIKTRKQKRGAWA